MSNNLMDQRTAAGAAYAQAARNYIEAGIELSAFDAAVEAKHGTNATVGGGFGERPLAKGHSEFLRDQALTELNRDPVGKVKARLEQLLRG